MAAEGLRVPTSEFTLPASNLSLPLSCHWPKLVPAQAGSAKCQGSGTTSPVVGHVCTPEVCGNRMSRHCLTGCSVVRILG